MSFKNLTIKFKNYLNFNKNLYKTAYLDVQSYVKQFKLVLIFHLNV